MKVVFIQFRNPKSEIRNSKQIRMTEIQMLKISREHRSAGFEHSDFEFVSDFVLRISDFRPAGIFALLAAVFAAGCARAPGAASRPPVVLISVDTLRADHLPAYGYRAVQTPAIDALAADSIRFT